MKFEEDYFGRNAIPNFYETFPERETYPLILYINNEIFIAGYYSKECVKELYNFFVMEYKKNVQKSK